MRPYVGFFLWLGCLLLAVIAVGSEQAVVKLNLVIPDGHKVTDVHLRFERTKDKAEGSFESEGNGEDDQEEGPSLGKGPGKPQASPTSGRHAVETFSGSPKKPNEDHNTIDRLIRLPRRRSTMVNIRK